MTSTDNTTFPIEAAEALAPYGADHVALYQYWQRLRDAAGGLPPWRSFDPIQMPQHLACLWVVEVHEAPLRLRYRLVGTRIVASYGYETTGKWFDEIWPHLAGQPDYTKRYTDALRLVQPNFRRGKPRMIAQRDWARIENLFLPFGHPGLGGIIVAYSHLYDENGRRVY